MSKLYKESSAKENDDPALASEEKQTYSLPTADEMENMLTEIRQLEQEHIKALADEDNKSDNQAGQLQTILSTIPAFSDKDK